MYKMRQCEMLQLSGTRGGERSVKSHPQRRGHPPSVFLRLRDMYTAKLRGSGCITILVR